MKRLALLFAAASAFVLMTATGGMAATRYVSLTGSNTWPYDTWAKATPTIQYAVDACSAGDTVLVTNGTYSLTAAITIPQQLAMTLTSVNGPGVTTIDGGYPTYSNRCISVASQNSNEAVVVEGFTIQNARKYNAGGGGGIYLAQYGTVRNCIIQNCYSMYSGGGGICLNNNGLVENCIIRNNVTGSSGGGITGVGTIRNCLITGNLATNVSGAANGGGIQSGGSVINCTIAYNHAVFAGGGIWSSSASLVNCIIYHNTCGSPGTYSNYLNSLGGILFTNCCTAPQIDASHGSGNFTLDPQFVDRASGNFRISSSSPCRDNGVNQAWMATAYDLDGAPRIADSTVDRGCYEYIGASYAIVASAGPNGTISPSGSVSVASGANQSFVISPDPGFGIASVTVDGASIAPTNAFTFVNVTSNHSMTASFELVSSGLVASILQDESGQFAPWLSWSNSASTWYCLLSTTNLFSPFVMSLSGILSTSDHSSVFFDNAVPSQYFALTASPSCPTDLVVYVPFEMGTTNMSGISDAGTTLGTRVYTNGVCGSAYVFNTANYLKYTNATSLNCSSMTLSMWLLMKSLPAQGKETKLLIRDNESSARIFQLTCDHGGYLNCVAANPVPWGIDLLATNSLSTNRWIHIAAVVDQLSGGKLWIDGQLAATDNSTGSLHTGVSYLEVGGTSASVNGSIDALCDEVRMYSRALSSNEVKMLYLQVQH